ncbi:MAG: hypothetical protein H6729_10350 [Deltaproteobacteria bacterium]|nr:hypothetical protein [Deltaproteobacteria bacterium]
MRQARTNVLTQEVTLNPGDTAYGLWPKGVPYSKQTLDALNPGTDWKSLRPGTKIILPAAPSQPSTVSRRGSLDSASAPKPNGSADASPQGSGADSERLGQLQKLAEETTTYRQRLGTRQVPTPKAAEAKELIERLNKAQKWVDDAKSNAAALTNKNDIGEQRAELARMKGDLPPIIKTFSGTFYASEPDPEAARAGAALDRLDESADALKEAQQDADKLLKPIPE